MQIKIQMQTQIQIQIVCKPVTQLLCTRYKCEYILNTKTYMQNINTYKYKYRVCANHWLHYCQHQPNGLHEIEICFEAHIATSLFLCRYISITFFYKQLPPLVATGSQLLCALLFCQLLWGATYEVTNHSCNWSACASYEFQCIAQLLCKWPTPLPTSFDWLRSGETTMMIIITMWRGTREA